MYNCNTKPLYCVRQDPRIPITNSIIIEIKRLRRSRGGVAVKSNMVYTLCKYMVYTFTREAGALE